MARSEIIIGHGKAENWVEVYYKLKYWRHQQNLSEWDVLKNGIPDGIPVLCQRFQRYQLLYSQPFSLIWRLSSRCGQCRRGRWYWIFLKMYQRYKTLCVCGRATRNFVRNAELSSVVPQPGPVTSYVSLCLPTEIPFHSSLLLFRERWN